MIRIIRTLSIPILLGLGILGWKRVTAPAPRVKAPVTRYHGYEINRQSINRAKVFTVLLSNEGFGGTARGTGILIDSTHVLTCAHMIKDSKDDMWVFPYPAIVALRGRVVFANTRMDLAIYELNRPVIISHYAVFQEMRYDGEPITAIGNILGCMKWFVSFGIVSGEWQGYVLTDALIHGGNSGGPWINEQGEVIAITDWGLEDTKDEGVGISGGVSAKTVNEFLKAWKSPSMVQLLQMMLGGN